jgi:hypothetical protein
MSETILMGTSQVLLMYMGFGFLLGIVLTLLVQRLVKIFRQRTE